MKELTILPGLFLVFLSCQKAVQNSPDYVNAAVQTDATAAMIGFTFDNGLQGWGKAGTAYVQWVKGVGRGLPKGSLGGEDLASADGDNYNYWWCFAAPDTALKVIQNSGALGSINRKLKFDIRMDPQYPARRRDYDGGYVWVRCPSFNIFGKMN